MPYAVNTSKGTMIHNDDLGDLPGSVAVPITIRQSLIAKHIIGVVVFESIKGIEFKKTYKGAYGIDFKEEMEDVKNKKYQEFVSEHKDVKVASNKWKEYKIKEANHD